MSRELNKEMVAHSDANAPNLQRTGGPTREPNGRFLTGNIGGGRPKGSRNRLSEVLLSAVVDDFTEHGADAIAQLRQKDPATYLRLVASLVPRELILAREEAPSTDYAVLNDAEVVRLLEARQRHKFIEKALDAV